MTIEQYPSSNNIATTTVWKYTATGSELTLSGYDNYSQALQFTAGSEQVYLNGVLLVRNLDYTPAANGLSITFPTSLAYNDFVQIYCYSNYSIASVASSSITGLIQNAQLTNSSITIGNQSISLGNAITTLTGTSISGSTNTLTNIPNSALSNSTIIINGNPISLGGTVNITTPNNILANKGGLIVGTGGGSVAQLTIGADGTYPIADSSQTTNISWAGPINTTGKNYVLNSNFESWQTRTSSPSTPVFLYAGQYLSADRWSPQQYQQGKYSRVSVTSAGPSSRYAIRSQSSTVSEASGGTRMSVSQRLDSYIVQNLRNKPVTLSYWVRFSNSTFTSVSNSGDSAFSSWYSLLGFNTTTTDLPHGTTGWDSYSQNNLVNGSYPTVWTKYTITTTVPSNANNIIVGFQSGTLGSTTTDGQYWFEVTDIQLEVGNVATSYTPSGGNAQGDIVLSGSSQFDGVLVSTNSSYYPSGSGQNAWAGYQVAGKNAVINGAMDFWTRGTSFSTSQGTFQYAFGADRWQFYRGGGGSTTQLNRIASDLTGFQYHARVQRTVSDTSTQYVGYWQNIETAESVRFAGKPVTLSFYARAGSNFSGAYLASSVYTGTGIDQAWYSATNSAAPVTQNNILTTTWQRFTVTGFIPSNVTELGVVFTYTPTSATAAGTNDYFEITGVQLEQGTIATVFSRHGGTITQELQACQRFCESSFPSGVAASQGGQNNVYNLIGSAYNTTTVRGTAMFKVTKRVFPTTINFYRSAGSSVSGQWAYYNNGGTYQGTGTNASDIAADKFAVNVNGTFTLNNSYIMIGDWVAEAEIY